MKTAIAILVIITSFSTAHVANAGGVVKLPEEGEGPVVYAQYESGETEWGRWLKEYTPAECASGEPGGCQRWRIYLVLDSKGDDGWGPVYATEKSLNWTPLCYNGNLDWIDRKKAFDLWLLKENYNEKYDYEICTARLSLEEGEMACAPRVVGEERKLALTLSRASLDGSAVLRLDPVHSSVAVGGQGMKIFTESANAKAAASGGRGTNRLVFVVGSVFDEPPGVYATPKGENWLLREVYEGPLIFEDPPSFKVLLVRADDPKAPSVCTAKISSARAVVESCRQLVEPKDREQGTRR